MKLIVPIAFLTLELRIEGAHSLKDKRQVLRSMKDKLRNKFNVAVAELDANDLWQRATIGVVSISGSQDYLQGLMENVERAAGRIASPHGRGDHGLLRGIPLISRAPAVPKVTFSRLRASVILLSFSWE